MIGQKVVNYRIVEQIGVGRMTTVYKAHDPVTNQYVAIKILPQYYTQDPDIRMCFQRDADTIVQMAHPHILPVFASGEDNGFAYLTMPFLQAGTLKDRVLQGKLSLPEAAAVITQIASALDYAHERGILHQDVKPSNILFDEEGSVYLSDFAIARMAEASVELAESGLLGTPDYMSPEQCAGNKNLGPASDQYSLGIVTYEMLTGRTPFHAETPAALTRIYLSDPVPPLRSLRPDLPESVQTAILKALAKEPGDRWPTCKHIAGALSRAFF